MFNCFNARTDRINLLSGIKQNKAFVAIMIMISVIQLVFVYLGGDVLRTAPLHKSELRAAIISALAVFPIEAARKIFWRLFTKKSCVLP